MRGPLADVARALRTLWVAGSGTPDPELARDLVQAAEAARGVGAAGLAGAIEDMAAALAAGDAAALFEGQLQAWVRLRGLQRGLAAGALRARLEAGPEADAERPPDGWTGTFHPLGAVVVPPRVHIHGVDDAGGWRTFVERSIHVDGYDAWSGSWISRLFQAELHLGRALSHPWTVRDHPGIATARRWVGKPAFQTRPVVGRKGLEDSEIPALPVAERLGVGRAEVVAQRGPDGWVVQCGGLPVRSGSCLTFNLDKLAATEGPTVRRKGIVLAGSGERVLLQWGAPPCFPTLDPGACTWRAEDVRRQATGGWGAVLRVLMGPWLGVEHASALAAMDGFPLPEGGEEGSGGDDHPEATEQAFWRQWVGALAGRAVEAPAPGLVAALRGAAAGEPVGPERLLQALWSLEHGGGLVGEGPNLAQVASLRPVPRDGDVLESVLQARLARHGYLGNPDVRNEEALHEAYGQRVEEEAMAVDRRLAHEGVLPALAELFWLGDAVAEVREKPRSQGVACLSIAAERLDRAAVAVLGRWVRSGRPPAKDEVMVWACVVESERMDVFVAK